jgi:hypothetical protein
MRTGDGPTTTSVRTLFPLRPDRARDFRRLGTGGRDSHQRRPVEGRPSGREGATGVDSSLPFTLSPRLPFHPTHALTHFHTHVFFVSLTQPFLALCSFARAQTTPCFLENFRRGNCSRHSATLTDTGRRSAKLTDTGRHSPPIHRQKNLKK